MPPDPDLLAPDRPGPDLEPVARSLMPAIGTVRRLLRRAAGPLFPADTLSTSQREVALLVGRHPGSPVAVVADELGLAPNSVSTIVTQLVAAGIVVRETDPNDRRIGRLSLTPEAREHAESGRARRRGVLHEALGRLTAEQVTDLTAGIGALEALAGELRLIERELDEAGAVR